MIFIVCFGLSVDNSRRVVFMEHRVLGQLTLSGGTIMQLLVYLDLNRV